MSQIQWIGILEEKVKELKALEKKDITLLLKKVPWKAWIEEQDSEKYTIFNQINRAIYVVQIYKENRKVEVLGKLW